jgi:hypothetical protein
MNTLQHLAQSWASYAKANDLRKGTRRYISMQHAYLNGSYAAIGAGDWPVIIDICIMSGRDFMDEVKDIERESGSDRVLVVKA